MSSPAAPAPAAPPPPRARRRCSRSARSASSSATSARARSTRSRNASAPSTASRPRRDNVMGLLSLITWSMTWVIAFKYLSVMMRADNNGEGGILALLALALRGLHHEPRTRWYRHHARHLRRVDVLRRQHDHARDLGALGGRGPRDRHARASAHWVIPLTIAILTALFLIQRHGTASVGALLRPGHRRCGSSPSAPSASGTSPRTRRSSRAANPAYAVVLPRRQSAPGLPRPRRRVPRADGRRGALRGHGALRQAARSASPGSAS